MTFRLYAVRAKDGDAVTVVAARAKLTARMRAGELRGVPYSRLVAREELDPPPVLRKYRCGQVALETLWSHREEQWHVEATYQGQRRYVTVDGGGGRLDREAAKVAARGAVHFLLGKDDLDEGLTVWTGGASPELHLVEDGSGGA